MPRGLSDSPCQEPISSTDVRRLELCSQSFHMVLSITKFFCKKARVVYLVRFGRRELPDSADECSRPRATAERVGKSVTANSIARSLASSLGTCFGPAAMRFGWALCGARDPVGPTRKNGPTRGIRRRWFLLRSAPVVPVRRNLPTLKIIKGGKTCDSERSIDA
jgi:hypothetical protein